MITKATLGVSLLMSIGISLTAQAIDTISVSEIAIRCRRLIRIEQCIAAYSNQCSLLDTTERITEASVRRFESLFASNAKVPNDLSWEDPYLMDLKDYVTIAYNHLDTIGIDAFISDIIYKQHDSWSYPFLEEVVDGRKAFTYEIPLTKLIMNGLDTNWNPIFWETPRSIPVVFVVRYYEDTDLTLILQILSEETFHLQETKKNDLKKR